MDVYSRWAATALCAVALLGIGLLAMAEAALATISRARLRELIEGKRPGAEVALALIEQEPRFVEARRLLHWLLGALALGAGLVASGQAGLGLAPATAALTLAVLAVQALGAAGGARGYLRAAPMLAPLVRPGLLLVRPFSGLLSGVRHRLAGSPGVTGEAAQRLGEEELRLFASVVGEDEAVELREEGREMIYSIVALGQTTIREVMVPRPDIVGVPVTVSMLEALDVIIREGHSRLPVYEAGVDNIVGVLYAKDLLAYLRDGRTDVPIRDVLRPPIFVPASRMADAVLTDLQGRRVHLAVVFDEYGGTAGLVTIEDILEEIVGEIQDEYDAEEASFVREGPFEAVVSGRYDIDDLNSEMDLELPTEENDTVGGLIYSALGRVPLVGDEVRIEGSAATFRVVTMVGRRIATVRVLLDQPAPPGDGNRPELARQPEVTDLPDAGGPEAGTLLHPASLLFKAP